jgi:PAS domain S-box-containing protein
MSGQLERIHRFEDLVENAVDMILLGDVEGKISYANRVACELVGYEKSEMIGKNINELFLDESIQENPFRFDLLHQGKILKRERLLRSKEGDLIPVEMVSRRMPDGTYHSFIRDIRDRKQMEMELKQSEDKFYRAFALSPDSININRMSDGKYIAINQGFTEITGWTEEDVYGRNSLPGSLDIWVNPEDRDRLLSCLKKKGEVLDFQAPFRRKDGRIVIGLMSARMLDIDNDVCILSLTRDITEQINAREKQHKLELQLQQRHKMESIGRLAGGVAHDFNNMLGIILGHAERGLRRLDSSHHVYADLQQIKKSAQRSAELTQQLLAFARKQPIAPKDINLNVSITALVSMLKPMIGENIQLIWQPTPEKCTVRMDSSQIDQILTNLCLNARDAIEGNGSITITTHICNYDTEYCLANPEVTLGEYVCLVVKDDGCGIAQEAQPYIFEPFYTTKKIGKGTGLGLATVYGIVKQNKGFVNIDSTLGKGTEFSLYFPLVNEQSKSSPQGKAIQAGLHGHETILLVEDEAGVLDITALMLEELDYTVLKAQTANQALGLAQNYQKDIHLLITDVIMPEMNGRDLAKKIMEYRPNIQTLFMSGYTADVIASHGVLADGVHFIPKPFSMQALAKSVRKSLERE